MKTLKIKIKLAIKGRNLVKGKKGDFLGGSESEESA